MNATYLDAIRQFEGFTPKAQWDYAQHTNGYGTKALFAGEVIDKAEADRRFQAEIAQARQIVERHAPGADEGTKAALTSLTFNAGDRWTRSGLGEALRSGDLDSARALFVQYNKAGGEVLPGLAARRLAEAAWIGQDTGAGDASPNWSALASATPSSAGSTDAPPSVVRLPQHAPAGNAHSELVAMSRQAPHQSAVRPIAEYAATGLVRPELRTVAAAEDAAALTKIKSAITGFSGEARLTQLMLASKLIGGASMAEKAEPTAREDQA